MSLYLVTVAVEVWGPDWPEDSTGEPMRVPKHLTDWPPAVLEEVTESIHTALGAWDMVEVTTIELLDPDS